MEIVNIDDLKSAKTKNKEEIFLEIKLEAKNLMKIPVMVFYHKEQGYKNYLISYDVENLPLPYSTFLPKIMPNLTKLCVTHKLKIGFKGIPKQIFEKIVLRPGNRWKFEDKFLMFDDGKVDPKYIEKFGENELKELEYNEEYYPLYDEAVNKFENDDLKSIAHEILDDFKKDKYYLRKRFVFVDSYPKTNEEATQERFVYYIYNREDDFENIYNLLLNYLDKNQIDELKEFLKKAEQIVISFGIMAQTGKLRTTLYFTTHDLETQEKSKLLEMLSLDEETNKLWGIGIDNLDGEHSFKVYYEEETINITEIKEYVSEIQLENKRKLLRFLNSRTKALKSILLDKKIKNGSFYSKRIDVSLQYNSVKIHQLMSLFDIDLRGLADKDLFTLSFELNNDGPEKINVYYALKIPEPEEELEEREAYRRNQY